MHPSTPTRFIDPSLLAGISHLDLVAKTVVDGFVAGLHRSPDFGFSQEFAEYRSYSPGDDLRHVDWNVFARTERMYLKRYRGETNSQLTLMIDTSASMGYSSHGITKLDYGRFLAVSLAYLANQQRDAFISMVVHELNQPLTSLAGYAQLLLRSEKEDGPRAEALRNLARHPVR